MDHGQSRRAYDGDLEGRRAVFALELHTQAEAPGVCFRILTEPAVVAQAQIETARRIDNIETCRQVRDRVIKFAL